MCLLVGRKGGASVSRVSNVMSRWQVLLVLGDKALHTICSVALSGVP